MFLFINVTFLLFNPMVPIYQALFVCQKMAKFGDVGHINIGCDMLKQFFSVFYSNISFSIFREHSTYEIFRS
jgi:hypothetical protein